MSLEFGEGLLDGLRSGGIRRYHFPAGSLMRKQPAQIVTNKRSPVVHVSTEVPRPVGEAFEDIARANGITKAELLRRLIQALVETMKRGKAGR
jgi:hypothetical protein